MPRQRVLLAVVVDDGQGFVPWCLGSVASVQVGHRDVDVLVLDDCGPDVGRCDGLRTVCDDLGFGYYRSPRKLGVPRSVNLALVRAVSGGYDYVFILNPAVVMPRNVVSLMIRVAEVNAGVGSVMAWSNTVSAFSMPGHDDAGLLDSQEMVEWIAAELEREFGSSVLDIPTGVGSCLLIPVPVVVKVGLFDPVHRRAKVAEVDWCLRSRTRGYRAVLAPSAFVVHQESGSTAGAGMLTYEALEGTEHDQIVALRYPWYRADVAAFLDAGALAPLAQRAVRSIILEAATRFGYEVEATWVPGPFSGNRVRVVVDPVGRSSSAEVEFRGFRLTLDVPGADLVGLLKGAIGANPSQITVSDRGHFVDQLVAAWEGTVPFDDRYRYPQRV